MSFPMSCYSGLSSSQVVCRLDFRRCGKPTSSPKLLFNIWAKKLFERGIYSQNLFAAVDSIDYKQRNLTALQIRRD